jgi:hypothetical protein
MRRQEIYMKYNKLNWDIRIRDHIKLGIAELGTILNWDIRIRHHIKLGYQNCIRHILPGNTYCRNPE